MLQFILDIIVRDILKPAYMQEFNTLNTSKTTIIINALFAHIIHVLAKRANF